MTDQPSRIAETDFSQWYEISGASGVAKKNLISIPKDLLAIKRYAKVIWQV